MPIKKLKIKNFKCFKDWFSVDFEKGTNILVGNNGTGKSTILEAINLVLTGMYHGKNIRNEIAQYLFNKDSINDYLKKINNKIKIEPPEIVIEVYFYEEIPSFLGDDNTEKAKDISGITLSIPGPASAAPWRRCPSPPPRPRPRQAPRQGPRQGPLPGPSPCPSSCPSLPPFALPA